MTNFTSAVDRKCKEPDAAGYIDVVARDKLAETSNTYLKQGTLVLIEGRLAIRFTNRRAAKSTKRPRS